MAQRILIEKLRLENRLSMQQTDLQEKIETYISLLDQLRNSTGKYNHLSHAQVSFNATFLSMYGDNALHNFHQLIMLELMQRFPQRVLAHKFPNSILTLFASEFDRILSLIESKSNFVFDWTNDLFSKDMGICSLRLIPTGARLLELAGFSRKPLLNNWRRLIPNLYFLFFKIKASTPLYQMHVHMSNLDDFHRTGWTQSLVRMGELLKLNPQVKGIHGTSWFYDPALQNVSSHLSYLREIPCEHGAKVFFVKNDNPDSDAFMKSKSRQLFFLRNEYTPKLFLLIWPRKELITFSEQYQHICSAAHIPEKFKSHVQN